MSEFNKEHFLKWIMEAQKNGVPTEYVIIREYWNDLDRVQRAKTALYSWLYQQTAD